VRLAVAVTVALALAACSPVTEMLVTVTAPDVQVGVEIDHLHLAAFDGAADFGGFDRTVALCADGAPRANCYALPLSLVLYPGRRTSDPVRLLVEAMLDSNPVISNVAIVRFTRGVRERLDVVFYHTCIGIGTKCSMTDRSCGADGSCEGTPMGGADLAGADLAGADLAADDLAGSSDDLPFTVCGARGMPCCGNGTCNSADLACVTGHCEPCGGASQWCCPSATPCGAGLGCNDLYQCSSDCGLNGGVCCAGGMCVNTCSLGTCLITGCGGASQGCCIGNICGDGLSCVNGHCVADACSKAGALCCATTSPAHCATGFWCDINGGACIACGNYGLSACGGMIACRPGIKPDPFAAICACDAPGDYCCGGTNGVCFGTVTCVNGTCK
jgi:hypothetical protein